MNSAWKPPMVTRASPLEILKQAEKLLGRKQIAAGLNVREDVVRSWFEGSGTLSNTHLLRLADLLVKYAAERG
jgi:hypothetical protein